MHHWNCTRQYCRPPNLSCSGAAQQLVSGGIAFDADSKKACALIAYGEI
jgi:hypothetical protein